MSDIFGEQAVLFKEKINYKLPGAGGFPAHQDAPAYVAFKQKLHITMMVAADPMSQENGCLEVVKGYHNKGVFPQNQSDGSITKEVEDSMKWDPVVTGEGEVMIFSSYIPHRSGPNSSNVSRRAYYLTFNGKKRKKKKKRRKKERKKEEKKK